MAAACYGAVCYVSYAVNVGEGRVPGCGYTVKGSRMSLTPWWPVWPKKSPSQS